MKHPEFFKVSSPSAAFVGAASGSALDLSVSAATVPPILPSSARNNVSGHRRFAIGHLPSVMCAPGLVALRSSAGHPLVRRPALPTRAVAMICGLWLLLSTGPLLAQTNTSQQAALEVLQRFIGARASEIVLQSIPQTNGCDVYEYAAQGGTLTVRGSSAVALCRGFYDYFKANGMGICSWATNRVALPAQWPDAPTTRVATPFRHHYFYNVVTYGYTMPYWDWPRWERELDWMALHGVDMPLALVATEAIGTRVWRDLGLTQAEIDSFYTGPAHLPWQRMGNVTGWDGPLSDAWHADQVALQHQILDRMRSLGITPIAPAFAGFVPAGLTNHYANLALTAMSWSGFSSQYQARLLLPNTASNTPVFMDIGRRYIQAWEQEFGTNQFFIADTFNEMSIPGTAALSQLSSNLYQSMVAGNSNAVWVIQGWMFGYQRSQWTTNNLAALVRPVPNDRMVILDLACDYNANVWGNGYNFDYYKSFFGKQWVYSTIPNMGGKTAFTGKLNYYATGVTNALYSANRGNLIGYGMAPEGTENNEAIYELCSDAGWKGQALSLDSWIPAYCRTRYGTYPSAMSNSWQQLRTGIYNWFEPHPQYAFQLRPSLSPGGTEYTSDTFIDAARQFLNASDTLGNSEPYRSDALEIAALAIGELADRSLQAACSAHQAGNAALRDSLATNALTLLRTADRLLESHPNLRLQRWVDFARSHGTTLTEADHYEANAKRILTVWGGWINDYACRIWSGLIRDYYVMRWDAFFNSLRTGQSVDWTTLEGNWIARSGVSQASPFADPLAVAKVALGVTTNVALISYLNGEENGSPLVDQATGKTASASGTGHAYRRASAPVGTYGAITLANSLGYCIAITNANNGAWDFTAANSAHLNTLGDNFTVMAWVYVPPTGIPSGQIRGIIGDDVTWHGAGWQLGLRETSGYSRSIVFTGFGIGDWYASGQVVSGTWQHIAAAKSYTGLTFYLNGVPVLTNTSATTSLNSSLGDAYGVARTLGGASYVCNSGLLLDEVRVYSGVLAASNIVAAANVSFFTPTNAFPVIPVGPYFTLQPTDAAIYAGEPLALATAVSGDPSLIYRWYRISPDGSATNFLPQATNAVLTVPAATADDGGDYFLVASNTTGTATSLSASVQVIPRPAGDYAASILADHPVAWWRLGETNGTVAYDYCGGHNGTVVGGVTFGRPGAATNDTDTAATFDGGTGYIEVPWAADLNPDQFTIECWARPTGGTGAYRSPLCCRDLGPEAGYIFYAASGNDWEFWTGSGVSGKPWTWDSGPAISLNRWTHLVGTYDASTGNQMFYVNGQLVQTWTNLAINLNLRRPLRIGAGNTESSPAYFFPGDIDEVALYGQALSAEQVQRHYELGIYGAPTLQVQNLGDAVKLTWQTGTLQSSDWVDGQFTDVPAATSPWTNTVSGPAKFFRVRL